MESWKILILGKCWEVGAKGSGDTSNFHSMDVAGDKHPCMGTGGGQGGVQPILHWD